MKRCTKCGVEKPRADFFVRRASKDGLGQLCKPCDKVRVKEWCLAHPEKRKVIVDKYRFANPEKVAKNSSDWGKVNRSKRRASYNKWAKANPEKTKLWVQNNPEKARERYKRYRAKNPHKGAADHAKRNARKIKACPPWADQEAIKMIYKEANRLTKETGVKHHVDHFYPLRGKTVSGLHVEFNLRAIPAIENLKKGNRLMPDIGVRALPMGDRL